MSGDDLFLSRNVCKTPLQGRLHQYSLGATSLAMKHGPHQQRRNQGCYAVAAGAVSHQAAASSERHHGFQQSPQHPMTLMLQLNAVKPEP